MTKYKYRIKTKEEFITHYGSVWRHSNDIITFVDNMDYLLGTYIYEQYYKRYLINNKIVFGRTMNSFTIDCDELHRMSINRTKWYIAEYMLVEEIEEPNYNSTKKLIYD